MAEASEVGTGADGVGAACGESEEQTAGEEEPPAAAFAAAVGVDSDGLGWEALPAGMNLGGILLVLSLLADGWTGCLGLAGACSLVLALVAAVPVIGTATGFVERGKVVLTGGGVADLATGRSVDALAVEDAAGGSVDSGFCFFGGGVLSDCGGGPDLAVVVFWTLKSGILVTSMLTELVLRMGNWLRYCATSVPLYSAGMDQFWREVMKVFIWLCILLKGGRPAGSGNWVLLTEERCSWKKGQRRGLVPSYQHLAL